MRINKFVAASLGWSRRQADEAVANGRVTIDGKPANLGQSVNSDNAVTLDGQILRIQAGLYVLMNKPAGVVCSRRGQGAKTVYQLLPPKYHKLKTVGRLDKDTSGLLLLTNDGDFAHSLTHPKFRKVKIYEINLDKPLLETDKAELNSGVRLDDGLSKLRLEEQTGNASYIISMQEGRNRQIRRTMAALNYMTVKLHRLQLGPYELNGLKSGQFKEVDKIE